MRDLFNTNEAVSASNLDVSMENLHGFLARAVSDPDWTSQQKVRLAAAAMDYFWNTFELNAFTSLQATRRELAQLVVLRNNLPQSTDIDLLRVRRADNFQEIVDRLTAAASDIP